MYSLHDFLYLEVGDLRDLSPDRFRVPFYYRVDFSYEVVSTELKLVKEQT